MITGLKPSTHYEFRVAAYTSKGRGDFLCQSLVTEPESPPKPRNLVTAVEKIDGKPAVRVKWHPPINVTVHKYK